MSTGSDDLQNSAVFSSSTSSTGGQAEPLDPKWHALARGDLSGSEVEALRVASEQSDEGRLLWELYRPCDEGEKRRLAERLHERIRAQNEASWWGRITRLPTPAKLAPLALAAAAALALPRTPPDAFVLSMMRGSADAAPRLDTPDSPLALTIVPQREIKYKPAVLGGLLVRDGKARAWQVPASPTSVEGEIVIAGPRRKLFPCVPEGEWDVLIAVGKPGEAPSQSEMMRRAGKGPEGGSQVLKTHVVLVGEGTDAMGGASCPDPAP